MLLELLAARASLKVARLLKGLACFGICCGASTILAVKAERELRELWHEL